MRKRSPTHPGAVLREDVLPSLTGMSVSAFARSLGVSRQTLHAVLAERSGVSAEMALRLGTLPCRGISSSAQTGTRRHRPTRCSRSRARPSEFFGAGF